MAEGARAPAASLLTLPPEVLGHVAALVEDTGARARLSAVCRTFRSALVGTTGATGTGPVGRASDGAEGSSLLPWRKLCLRGAHVRDPAAYASLVAWLRPRAHEVREAELMVKEGDEGSWEQVLDVLGPRLTTLSLIGGRASEGRYHPLRQPLVTWTARLCQQLISLSVLLVDSGVVLDDLSLLTGLTQLTLEDQGDDGDRVFPLALCSLTGLRELTYGSYGQDSLRPEVSRLAHLTQLHLRAAEVQLSDPCWAGLTRLRALYLSLFVTGSEFDEPAAAALSSRLEVLDINAVHFAGNCFPSALYDLRRLVSLRVRFQGEGQWLGVPDQFSRLTKLRSLALEGCGLVDVPATILALPLLQQLRLVGNDLARLPDAISQLTGLRELCCESNCRQQQRQCDLPTSITSMTRLERLSLQGHRLGGMPVLASLANLAGLRVIDLRECSVLPDGLVHVMQLAGRLHIQGRSDIVLTGRNHPHFAEGHQGEQ